MKVGHEEDNREDLYGDRRLDLTMKVAPIMFLVGVLFPAVILAYGLLSDTYTFGLYITSLILSGWIIVNAIGIKVIVENE